jgi:hypothetical protein
MESVNNQKHKEKPVDKLKGGPCKEDFALLKACARRKGLLGESEKQQMQACPSETDRLITCVNKNPLFFQS